MDIEKIRDYCITKPHVSEEFPFDEVTLVFKVAGKMFALTSLNESPAAIALKCDPEKAVELREQYPCVQPGYHFNKKHWNTINLDSSVPDKLIKEWIDHSYNLVIAGLPKNQRIKLGI
jgi:predicted DNA-binding protein (MmcQ/YjbR family)